jgi:hyperosmotically inducible protein
MKPRILGQMAMAAALLSFGIAGAWAGQNAAVPGPAPSSDEALAKQVRHEIVMYPHYTIWDEIDFQVNHGSVELIGEVNQPYKKSELGKIVAHVPGVESVTNQLEVLPLSPMDDRLRLQVARAIYRDSALSRYGQGVLPSIHIIVDNGHVTLAGVVANDFDKQVAGVRASSVGLSFGPVKNDLRVEKPAKKS